MDPNLKSYTPAQRPLHQEFKDLALGLVSTRSFPAIVGVADMMLKTANVHLVGYEKIGEGYCTAIVRGRFAEIRLAVEAGREAAEKFGQLQSSLVIPRPLPNLEYVLPISTRLSQLAISGGHSRLSHQAVGLLETRGFPAMVGAVDAMLKAAEVYFASYETIGAGLCTAIVRGAVTDVAVAIEVGMHEAERIGELSAVMVIPRPLDDLEQTLPLASCWIDQPEPLKIPLKVKEKQKDFVQLSEVQQELKTLTLNNEEEN
ncbi:MAG: BMC domain-containing protein [Oscillatoriales cyanobacterium RM2_1_1]|nr:BMC domain-containing protein [Oscillatoriales cyanobacterium SM2_3_0]NJO47693.1 BMC domain-containing protein [Oscillatoriales cyanobacterium RM2_1_1]